MDCPFGFSAAVRFDHGYTGLLPVRVQYNKFFAEVVHLLIKFFNFLTVVYADAPGRVLHTEHIGYVVCTIFLECRESEPTPLFYFSLYADPPPSPSSHLPYSPSALPLHCASTLYSSGASAGCSVGASVCYIV
jgi:hypothetical protein